MATVYKSPLDQAFEETAKRAQARVSLLPDDYYSLPSELRSEAFTASGLASLDQIKQIMDSLSKSLASGSTLRQWRESLSDDALMLGKARLETIYRNAIQTAYSNGRTDAQIENKANRPFLMWDAINDSRTRPSHRAMDGFIAPIDDPIWQRWSCPAGHRCRCSRISLSESQAIKRGYVPGNQPPADVQPDPGWGYDKSNKQARDALMTQLAEKKLVNLPREIRQAYDDLVKQFKQPSGDFTIYDQAYPRVKPDVSTPARKAAVAFENDVRNDTVENGAFFAEDGKLLLEKRGTTGNISLTASDVESVIGAELFTHNHPNRSPFSAEDVFEAFATGWKELRAVTSYARYVMIVGDRGWQSKAAIEQALNAAEQSLIEEVKNAVIVGDLHSSEYGIELRHRAWVKVAKQFGFVYIREPS